MRYIPMMLVCLMHTSLFLLRAMIWLPCLPYATRLVLFVSLDLVMWVCAQGTWCRCIFMIYCVHDHRSVIVSIHVTWVTLVSLCMRHASICLMLWGASARPSTCMLACPVYTSMKSYRCTIVHQTWDTSGFLSWN